MDFAHAPSLDRSFYLRDTLTVARRLIGHVLLHETSAGAIAGRIVETEAYLSDDPANHATYQITNRNRVLLGPPGQAYVYMIHGRWIISVVTQPEGIPEVVHLRALEPVQGVDLMIESRGTDVVQMLCKGPGNLTRALRIDDSHKGADLVDGPLRIVEGQQTDRVRTTTRVGITRGGDLPYRFYSLEHAGFVSRR